MYVEPWVELQVNLNQLCFLFSFQWDILCDDAKKYVPLTKTIFYAGKLFGAYFFGWVSDRYGRRMTLLITMLVQFIASLIESFSVNFTMYVVLRVPLGICSGGKIKYLHVLVYTLVSFTTSRAGLESESRNALRLLDCVTPAQEVVQDVCMCSSHTGRGSFPFPFCLLFLRRVAGMSGIKEEPVFPWCNVQVVGQSKEISIIKLIKTTSNAYYRKCCPYKQLIQHQAFMFSCQHLDFSFI